MFASNCPDCGTKNLRFIKMQEASRLLSSILRVKLPTSDIPIFSIILFVKTIVLFL